MFIVCNSPNNLARRESRQKLTYALVQQGVRCVGCDLSERLKDKSPFVHGGMGNDQSGYFDDEVAIKNDIDVDDARAFGLRTHASHVFFESECSGEKLGRGKLRIKCDNAVQEPGLRGHLHGLGFVERRLRS